MTNLINLPKEEPKEEEPKEEEPIFKNEVSSKDESAVAERHQKPKEDLEVKPVSEPIDIPKEKTKRTRNMSEAAKKQLDHARQKSIETRKANALRRKQEKEEKELTNKKYIDEIGYLKEQIQELKNKQPQEKIVEKVIYKEKEINEEESYKFTVDDLDYYATEYLKKHKEAEEQIKSKRNQDIRNKYFLNMR